MTGGRSVGRHHAQTAQRLTQQWIPGISEAEIGAGLDRTAMAGKQYLQPRRIDRGDCVNIDAAAAPFDGRPHQRRHRSGFA